MAKKKYKINDNKSEVSEHFAPYEKIHFLKSFEEMEEHNAKEMAMLSPLQHLKNATALIKKIFSKELKAKNDLTIYFK